MGSVTSYTKVSYSHPLLSDNTMLTITDQRTQKGCEIFCINITHPMLYVKKYRCNQ